MENFPHLPDFAIVRRIIEFTGLQIGFLGKEITKEQISDIQCFINTHLDVLSSNDGYKAGDTTVFLTKGRDCISFDEFVFNAGEKNPTEWCLVLQGKDRTGNNIYNLLTIDSVKSQISPGRHPFLRRKLEASDVLRGQQVVALFNNENVGVNPLPPEPGFITRLSHNYITPIDNRIKGAVIIIVGLAITGECLYFANFHCSLKTNFKFGLFLMLLAMATGTVVSRGYRMLISGESYSALR